MAHIHVSMNHEFDGMKIERYGRRRFFQNRGAYALPDDPSMHVASLHDNGTLRAIPYDAGPLVIEIGVSAQRSLLGGQRSLAAVDPWTVVSALG